MNHTKNTPNLGSILDKFAALSGADKSVVITAIQALADRNPAPLEALRIQHAENAELVALIDEAINSISGGANHE